MCGIVGALGPEPIEPECLTAMRDRLVHRGPDHGGLWLADDGRVGLGHRRLAIVDLNAEANQPFHSTDGRFVITFNGEIYNFVELRGQLIERGATFRTRSDTEVLLEAFRHWGPDCLRRISGMFAFAIWDRVERRLFCARDRAGEKPFYYTLIDGAFVFASELKALVPWPGFSRRIDYNALIDYLHFGFVADPKAIWDRCLKLPPGHAMTVDVGRDGRATASTPVPYWDMEFAPDDTVVDWEERIRDTLMAASREMAFADVPLGAFLSGGVDSSSVIAALRNAGYAVQTFTIGFQEADYDERPWARTVADLYGTTHTERVVQSEDVAAVFPKMLWHYDEPFNDYSCLPTYCLCRAAREHITVALSGDGGDELFAGYRKYQRLALRESLHTFLPDAVTAGLFAGAVSLLPASSPRSRHLAPYALDSGAMLTDMLNTGFPRAWLQRAARGPLADALRHYDPIDVVAALIRKAPPAEVGLINTMRYLDLKLTLAGDILVKVDRASMAVSLEVRPVYLHRDMLALAARIPPARLATRRQSKKLLKEALRAWLPDTILHRPKRGFALPLDEWLQADRAPLGRAGHNDHLHGLLDVDALAQSAAAAPGNGMNAAAATHSLAFLSQWLAHWT